MKNKKIVPVVIAIALTIFALGNFHIVNGSQSGFHIVKRLSFGFSEMFVNSDQIVGMPLFSAKSQHPLGVGALQRIGAIETDEQFQARIQAQIEAETQKMEREMREAMRKAEEENRQLMRSMGL